MDNIKGFIKKIFSRKKEAGLTVTQLLNGLTEPYIVFSGMLYNNSEIHHVVFSRRQGLFIVNAVTAKGEVTYNGTHLLINNKPRSEAIKKALKDTFWLKSTIREQIGLDVYITPIVVFENTNVRISEPIIGVAVIEWSSLIDTITKAPDRNVLEDGMVMVLRELHGIHTINNRTA